MPFHFIVVHVIDPLEGQASLNAVLARERVINIDKKFVDQGQNSFWSFCIESLPSGAPDQIKRTAKPRIDSSIEF